MEPEEIRKLAKRIAVGASFFVLALFFSYMGRDGRPIWRGILLIYAMLVTVVMVLAILVQSGRGGGLAGLGGAGGESILGARAATPIAKATYVLGALLLFICMLLARMGHVQDAQFAPAPHAPREETAPMVPEDEPAPDPDAEETIPIVPEEEPAQEPQEGEGESQ